MNYAKYFHSDQMVAMKVTIEQEGELDQFDSLFGLVDECIDNTLAVAFPPPYDHHADYPFRPGQEVEILSDRHGMGFSAKTLVSSSGRKNEAVCLEFTGDLNYFNRRRNPRIEVQVWIGLEKCSDSTSVMKGRWQQQADHFRGDNPSPNLANFSRREISLSSNGIGINEETLSETGDYFLVYLALENDKQIICTLGEVVRAARSDEVKYTTGIHFDCIVEEDRQRIERFVKQHAGKD